MEISSAKLSEIRQRPGFPEKPPPEDTLKLEIGNRTESTRPSGLGGSSRIETVT
jgi:hypothetical protein